MRARPLPLVTSCQNCRVKASTDLCDLNGMSPEFEAIGRSATYQPGQFIFYEGHAASGLYILCSGRVKLIRSMPRGVNQFMRIIDPGTLIEKHTLQEGSLHEATCEALEPSQIRIVDRMSYLALLARHGELAVRVIKLLSRDLQASYEEGMHLAFNSARARLARVLLELAERYGESGPRGTTITLRLKREELAQMAAISLETAVRILKRLQRVGVVAVSGRDLTILESGRLARIAGSSSSFLLAYDP